MIFSRGRGGSLSTGIPSNARKFFSRLGTVSLVALSLSALVRAQAPQESEVQAGEIMGTVIDVNSDPVAGATVALVSSETTDRRSVVTADNGFFKFEDVKPGTYVLNVSAEGFADSTSPAIPLDPGEVKLLDTVKLAINTQQTTVKVSGDPVEIATQQVKFEETQRIFGVIPNFYISYDGDNAVPLTTKMKFDLALKVSRDPITFAGIALVAGVRQAGDYPDYGQGAKGYSQRVAVTAAPVFTDIMIGGAILPSLLHQDPRYFYQGTGTTGSRLRHAMLAPFICKGDNGKSQPNYSTVGGDLASAALANLYYPPANRGAEFVFSSFAIGTAERVISTVAQEFILNKYTHRGVRTN
jgi:hypothetical protein